MSVLPPQGRDTASETRVIIHPRQCGTTTVALSTLAASIVLLAHADQTNNAALWTGSFLGAAISVCALPVVTFCRNLEGKEEDHIVLYPKRSLSDCAQTEKMRADILCSTMCKIECEEHEEEVVVEMPPTQEALRTTGAVLEPSIPPVPRDPSTSSDRWSIVSTSASAPTLAGTSREVPL